jgi:hypothetical protein
MQRKTGLPATRSWKNFWRALSRREDNAHRGLFGRAANVLPVHFLEAANGVTRALMLPEGKTLQATIRRVPTTGRSCG